MELMVSRQMRRRSHKVTRILRIKDPEEAMPTRKTEGAIMNLKQKIDKNPVELSKVYEQVAEKRVNIIKRAKERKMGYKKTSPEDVNLSQIGNSGNTKTSRVSATATVSNKNINDNRFKESVSNFGFLGAHFNVLPVEVNSFGSFWTINPLQQFYAIQT